MSRGLHTFHGGLHMPGNKELSTGEPVVAASVPHRIVLPLHQHIGAPAKAMVEVGEKVLKGQMVARPDGYVSAPIHASTSGTVVAIEELPVPHPSGLSAPCIVIETDGEETWAERRPVADPTAIDPSELRNIIRDAGIVGLGGAGFPSYVKLNPGPHTQVETLILNGAECEPYITCDDMLMREQPEAIIEGARIMQHAIQARRCLIGVEDNKPDAFAALSETIARLGRSDIEAVLVPTRYPTGGEKQLIKVLTGKEVPSQGLPVAIGVVCHNVATAASVYRAVALGEPLISRIVTVTGTGVRHARNLEVLIGTPVAELIEQCGGTVDAHRLVMGGPMMGFDLDNDQVPVIKTGNCILVPGSGELERRGAARPCIRCGECARACPVSLLPQQLYWYSRSKDFDKAQDYNLFDCIECGCCAYVCPSNLPLVQYYRFAKTEIWAQERERKKSDLARQRHEFRVHRQEREKAEREARLKQKKAAVQGGAGDDKKAAIQAAMERAKAKRAEAQPKNVDDLTPEQKEKLAAAKARREAKLAQNESGGGELTEEQKAKLAAARARQEARKGAPKAAGAELTPEQKEKLAAAKARREAKLAAEQSTEESKE